MEGSNTNPVGVERQILGNLLLYGAQSYDLVGEILDQGSWSVSTHQELWSWIKRQVEAQGPISPTIIIESVGNQGILNHRFGGAEYLAQLPNNACLSAQLAQMAELVAGSAKLRQLSNECNTIQQKIREGITPVEELIADAERRVLGVNITGNRSSSVQSLRDVAKVSKKRVQRIQAGDVSVEYVPTFFPSFDEHYTGLPRGWPSYFGGRPKMGKTMFALGCMLRGADPHFGGQQIPWGMVSLEMPSTKLVYRLAATKSGVSWSKVRSGEATDAEMDAYYQAIDYLAGLPIFIDDTVRSVEGVVSAIRRMARVNQCSGVIVDYFQLVKGGGRNAGETAGWDAIGDEIRDVAKTEDIALLCLSQLNQKCEQRTTKGRRGVPNQGGDFRGTEKMFQDAGFIAGVYREFHYHPPKLMGGKPYDEQRLGRSWQPMEFISIGTREDSRKDLELYVRMELGQVADPKDPGFEAPVWQRK